jgi:hypothetical protein
MGWLGIVFYSFGDSDLVMVLLGISFPHHYMIITVVSVSLNSICYSNLHVRTFRQKERQTNTDDHLVLVHSHSP